MNNGTALPRLAGCDVLPPMEPSRPPESPRRSKTPKGKSGDRFKVLNAFVDFTLRSLRGNEAAVWMVLYRDTKGDGTARTSIADIARRSGTSTRTALRVVARLERRGLLKIIHRGGLRRGCSIYRVLPLERESSG